MSIAPVIQIHAKVPAWSFPERLRKVRREEVKLTQAEFADLLGVKESTYSAWESGRNTPDILKLSDTLEEKTHVSRYWFRGDLDASASYDPDTDPDNGSHLGESNSGPSHYNVVPLFGNSEMAVAA